MKKEYNFTKGIRGEFYHLNARLNLPIYLDKDNADIVQKVAKQKKIDSKAIAKT